MLTRWTGQLRLSQALTSKHSEIREIAQALYALGLNDEDASVGIFRWEMRSSFSNYIPVFEVRLKRHVEVSWRQTDILTLKKGRSLEMPYILSWHRKYANTMGWPLGAPISVAIQAWVKQEYPFDKELA